VEARSVYQLQLLLLALYFAAAALLWPTLPGRVPIHFDFAGRPTTWARTSMLSWFGLPLITAAMTLFLYGMGRASNSAPELWNIPEKKRFLALSPATRAPIVAYLSRAMAWSAVMVSFTFIGIHVGVYQTAMGRSTGLAWQSHLLSLAPMGVLLLVVSWIARNAGEQIRQASEREKREQGERA
jgi:multisubunit Na+/H+ antiporter MnhC subunit